MRKRFNVTGLCIPQKHYMVNLVQRLAQIKEMVDEGAYFTIHRARQYGKTTLLYALESYLKADYVVISIDFQKLGTAKYENENRFALSFADFFMRELARNGQPDVPDVNRETETLRKICQSRDSSYSLYELFENLNRICEVSPRPVVLMIDEADSASNNQVFLDFLAMLRGYYLDRENSPIFHSVILAGVYDIKNMKLKIRPEEEYQYNSPWNIAARFHIDMSFTAVQIASMLEEYEQDNHTGMNVEEMARCIYDYTSGYPYLVSAICKFLDEEIPELEDLRIWARSGPRRGFGKQ